MLFDFDHYVIINFDGVIRVLEGRLSAQAVKSSIRAALFHKDVHITILRLN